MAFTISSRLDFLVASMAVVVDPIDDGEAKAFSKHFGFIPLEGSKRMFIPMVTIAQGIGNQVINLK